MHSRTFFLSAIVALGIAAAASGAFPPESAYAQGFSQDSIVFPIIAPRLSSKYGARRHPVHKFSRHHSGVDLAAPNNSHIRAIAAGTVVFADKHGGFGKLVTIEHSDGYSSLYGHLSDIAVNPGQQVKPGEIIGRVGSTGTATGPHLHFEWRLKGKPIDPLEIFPGLAEKADG